MNPREIASFMETIVETPDDDTPRLVFADFVEEHGDIARAQLIRYQCEQYRLSPFDRRYCELNERINDLLKRHSHRWIKELPVVADVDWLTFERGFIHSARVRDRSVLTENVKELLNAAPLLDSITLTVDLENEDWRDYEPLEWLHKITLWSEDYLVIEDLGAFAECALLEYVRDLNLKGLSLENAGVATLLESTPFLRRLEKLRLDDNFIGEPGVEAIAAAGYLKHLTELHLDGQGYGSYSEDPVLQSSGVRALAGIRHLNNLEVLHLSGNQIDANGLAAILTGKYWKKLHTLRLHQNEFSSHGIAGLVGLQSSIRLRSLDLSSNPIKDLGAVQLAKIPAFAELARLNLTSCEIGPEGMRSLTKAPFWPNLKQFEIDFNRLEADGAYAIREAAPTTLHTLKMRNCRVGDEGAQHLAAATGLTNLLDLDLTKNGIEDPGAEALGRSASLANVQRWCLSDNSIHDRGLHAFATGPGADRVRMIDFSLNKISGSGLVVAVKRWPELTELNLHGNPLSADVWSRLSGATWYNLREFNVISTQLTAKKLAELLRAPFITSLAQLHVAENPQLGDEGARLLANSEALRGLALLNIHRIGATSAGIEAVMRSPFLQSLAYLTVWGNPLSRELREEHNERFPEPGEDIPF